MNFEFYDGKRSLCVYGWLASKRQWAQLCARLIIATRNNVAAAGHVFIHHLNDSQSLPFCVLASLFSEIGSSNFFNYESHCNKSITRRMELNVCVVKRGNWISDGSFYYNILYINVFIPFKTGHFVEMRHFHWFLS